MRKFFLALGLVAGLFLWAPAQPASAATINYRAVTYGTNKASMAAKYFVTPAKVVANGDQYLVTMTIHTGASLGKWPVTVLSVAGVGPANVTKTRNNGGYDYRYAFETADLGQPISAELAINVAGVYAAQNAISFKFDTSHLPKLAAPSTAPAAQAAKQKAAAKAAKASAKAAKRQAVVIAKLNAQNAKTQKSVLIGGSVLVVLLAGGAWRLTRPRKQE